MKTRKLTTLIGLILVMAMVFSVAFSVVAFAEESTEDEPTLPVVNKLEALAVLGPSANNGYTSQTGDAPAYAYKETSAEDETNTNVFLRLTRGLTSATWSSFALITDVVTEAGIYKLGFDVRIPDDYVSNNFSVVMHGGTTMSANIIGNSKETFISAMTGEADEWGFRHIETSLNVPSSESHLKFMLNVSENAYIDVDNITLIKQVSDTTLGEENLEGTRNHSFEGFDFVAKSSVLQASPNWNNSFIAGGDANTATLITTPGEGSVLKLYNSNNGFASFVKDSYNAYTAGDYTVKVTVEAGSAFSSNNIGFRINKSGGKLVNDMQFENRSEILTDGTETVLTATFTLDDGYSDWTHFNMWCNNNNSANENNYLLIKKIEICKNDGVNLDTKGWLPSIGTSILTSGSWSSGWYLPAGSSNNIAVVEDGEAGNHVVKLTQKDASVPNNFISFTYALDASKYEAGHRYAVKLDVKAGSNFATNNLGVGFARTGGGTRVAEEIMPYEQITSAEWTTIYAILDIPEGAQMNGNMDIWLSGYTGSGTADENSYLLIDNLKIVTVSDPVWGDDLLTDKYDGTMEGMEEGTVPQLKEVPDYSDYYAHKMIQKGDFESFTEDFRFGTATQATQYWGSINVDAPGTIIKDGDNNLLKLKYDDNSTHTFASAFVMIDQDKLVDGNVYVLKFSYKLVGNPTHAKVSFISETNKDILCLDIDGMKTAGTYTTSGENVDVFACTITESELSEGWFDAVVPFTTNFKFQSLAASLRFLLYTGSNSALEMYVDNVDLTLYEEECTNHEDADGNYVCDKCGERLPIPTPTECDKHVDENGDGKCDVCGKDLPAKNNTLTIVLIVVGCVLVVGAAAAVTVVMLKRRKSGEK